MPARVFSRSLGLKTAAWMASCMPILFSTPALASDIDTSQSYFLASKLGSGVNPDFKGGTLRIDSNSTFTQNFTLENFSTNTIDANGHTATLSGVLSSTGGMTFVDGVGGGTVTLSGTNTYTGATTITAGTLALSGTGSIADSSSLTDNATFDISQTSSGASIASLSGSGNVVLGSQTLNITSGSGTFTGVISGTGSLTMSGGTEILTGANTYSGNTNVAGGTLQIGNGAATGSITGNVSTGGTLAFDRSDVVTFGGTISGAGGVTQMGPGTLTLNAADTYTGATTISAGTLSLSGNGSVASSSAVIANGTFDISQMSSAISIKSLGGSGNVTLGSQSLTLTSGASTFSGIISGSGGVTVTGGTQALSGTNTYTGPTAITSGTLQLGAGGTTGSVVGGILDNGTLAFNFSSGTFAGVISGTGNVSVTGTGKTTLTAANTYTGSTTISGGTLALSGSGSIQTSSGLADNGTFDISAMTTGVTVQSLTGNGKVVLGLQSLTVSNASGIFSGVVSGSGGLAIAAGNQVLSGSNTFTGQTTIASGATLALSGSGNVLLSSGVVDNGTLDVSAGTFPAISSLSGSGSVIVGGQALTLSNAVGTFSGNITGSGGITLAGGTETLTGVSNYSGVTTISAGTLALSGNGSIAGTQSVNVTGTFDISAATAPVSVGALTGTGNVVLGGQSLTLTAGAGTFSGAISGAGGLTVTGGSQVLSGTNTYTGGTTISAGTLQLGSGGTTGTVIGNVVDNGNLAFNYSSGTFAATISGTGTVNQIGTGTTTLLGTDTYSGGTTITRGTLQLGNGGSQGSITGDVADNGTLAFNRSGAVSFSSTVSGAGGVSQLGSGTTTLTGLNTYTGTTVISAGTLALSGAGSIATSSGIADNGVFDVSGATSGVSIQSLSGAGDVLLGAQDVSLTNASGTYSGVISGTGGLTLTSGTEILTGDNTYTGTTTVRGSTLIIDGSATSSAAVKVSGGGTVGGTGVLPSTTIGSGATLAAGDSGVGTLHVDGTATFSSGSNFNVYVSKAAASELVVSGAATLGGTVSVTPTDGYPLGKKLTVLTAGGGLTGSFTLASATSAGGNFAYKLSEDASNVYLEIDLAEVSSLLPSGATRNQTSVAQGIDAAISRGDTLPQAFQDLGTLSSAELANATTQLSGEIGSEVPQAGRTLFNAVVSTVFDRITDLRQQQSQSGSDPWFSVYGGTARLSGETTTIGSHPLDGDTFGIAGGEEWVMSPVVTLGAALSGGSESFSLDSGLGRGRANAFTLAGYGHLTLSPHIYGAFLLGAGVDDVHTRRTLTVSGTDTLTGQVTAFDFGGRYETGVNFDWGTPYFAAQTQFFDTPAYHETALSGSSVFALDYAAHSANATRFELGLDEGGNFDLGDDGVLALTGRLAWAYELTGSRALTASFADLAGSGFRVEGATPDANSGLVSLGADFKTASGIGLSARFDGDIARGSQSYLGTAGINFTW